MSDSTNSIFRSAQRFFAGTMLSRISGFLRDIAMAIVFGTNETVAAFLLAFRLAHLLRRILGEGALQSAFIPYFEKMRSENPSKAAFFFEKLAFALSLLLLLLIGSSVFALFLSKFYVNPIHHEVIDYTNFMLPSLLFICLFGINASLLQCEKKYFLVGVAPVAFNMIWIIGVFFLRNVPIEEAMSKLCWIVIGACAAQWLVTLPSVLVVLKKLKKTAKDTTISFKDLKAFIKPLALGIVGIGATQVNSAVDAVFGRLAENEGPAYLWYAIRLQQLPLALFGLAISGALLPPLSRAIRERNQLQFNHFLNYALGANALLMIPLTLLFFLTGDNLVRILFGYGSFGVESVRGTSLCFWGYTLGLLPMTTILILGPAFYAQDDFKATTRASFYALGMNAVLNAFFIYICGFGAFSIAIATSLSAWVNAFYLYVLLKSRTGFQLDLKVKRNVRFISASSLLSSAFIYYIKTYLSAGIALSTVSPALECSLIGLGFMLTFWGLTRTFKVSLSFRT